MNNVKTFRTWVFVAPWFITFTACAGISLDRTRLIMTGNDRSASANLTNNSANIPFLAQSWIEDEHGKKITSPLMVLPPLQRINGGEKAVVRVTGTPAISGLPQDRETLFYLNVREIPPKASKPNVLQLAMQSRIKLFFRPAAIVPKSGTVWQEQVVFRKQGNQFIAQNPTPYYITIIGLAKTSVEKNKDKLTTFPGIIIAPKSNMTIPVSTTQVNQFSMMYVNDFGGHPEIRYSCVGDTCQFEPYKK